MAARSRARYLAPIALAAAIAGTYVIVHHGLTTTKATSHQTKSSGRRPHGRYARVRYYRVRGGDSLTSIAAKTGVPLNTLESLNPGVDPNSLQMGQRLRLRR
jgi:LysM repeat protein